MEEQSLYLLAAGQYAMNRLQRFFLLLLPRSWGRGIEAESRAWKARCLTCDHESSVWELGGIRYKAAGNPRKLFPCPRCGKPRMHTVHHQPQEAGQPGAA